MVLVKYFPNSAVELPKIFDKCMEIIESPQVYDWNCRFIFLLWISLLIQCPFDLKRVFRSDAWNRFYQKFIENIVRDRLLLDVGGKELQAAAVLLASLLKRPSESTELEDFLNWCDCDENENKYKIGILTTLVQLGKAADDQILLPHCDKIEKIFTQISCNSSSSTSSSKLLLKLRAKLVQLQAKLGKPIQLGDFIAALKNRDTVIRWTAAKCLRRIAEAFPSTRQIIFKTLCRNLEQEFNSAFEVSPHVLHGFFLAIGQLLNYRLIEVLDEELPDLIIKGLKFDQIKGSYAVGSFVRDASCYVIWSFARYNNHLITISMDHKIIAGLACMALFDREVAGRRAAAAALQEFIGRIGGERQSAYLPILTHVHFFSVAALEKSFRFNALEIAKELGNLVPNIADHLLQVSLFNFDKNVRRLAAVTLGDLCAWCPDITGKLVEIYEKSDDLFAMHGALLAMASLHCSHSPQIVEISLKADRIPQKSLGADLLLEGHLKLIAAIASEENVSDENLSVWLKTILSGLKSRSDDVRETAIYALQSLANRFGPLLDQFFLSCLTGIEKERDVNYQKGLLGALSTCPESFFSKHGTVIIKLLLKTAKTTLPINDIEKRCIAIDSIGKLLQIYKSTEIEAIKDCLVSSLLCDYSIDTRGDVGSKVRMAALKLVEGLPRCPEIDDLILEQAFARLDRLRTPAMAIFFPSETFEIEGFAHKILELPKIPLCGAFRGLIFSCGGLDPQMTKTSALIIELFIAKWGSVDFEEVCLSSLQSERLCVPSIQTVANLLNRLSNEFIEAFCLKLITEIIPKSSNIRKLIPAFSLVIQVNVSVLDGKYVDFLMDQGANHKFPAIRQLIQDRLK